MSIPKFQVQKNLTPPATIAISGSPDYVGTYGSGTTYATGDVVTYNNSSYVARQATTGNTPGDTAYWQTLAAQGNTGATGPAGASGSSGTDGVINTLTAGTNLNGGGSASTVTVNLDSDISINSATFAAASPLVFEGATANDYETTVAVTDPTADRTVTIPDGSGTIAYLDSSITGNAATATTATTATNVTATANNSADETVYLTFVDGATGSQGIETDTGLNYNPNSGVLTTTSVTGNLTGNVTGNTSGTSGSTTGNAATATALQTARNIGGVSFDGTGNIDLPGVNAAGNQNTSGNATTATTATTATNVTATANNTADETVYLTFVDGATGGQGIETDTGLNYNPSSGVLTTTSVTGNLTGNVTGNVSGTAGSATGNAATATALQTARNIGGVSFDGTGNIDLPGVNAAGNQNTSGSSASTTGNAATATALATARNINGVSFDGTGNITVTAAAGTLSGTELKSTVVTSSLTSVGTLSALTVSGTVTIDSVGITAVQTSAESFADNDTSLMTSAAIDDRINAASGASAGGSNTQVQYNSSGNFAGSANLTFNGTTLTANAFSGPLTGNVTGNASGSSGSCTGNSATATEATNVTATANNSADETVYLTFVDGATGTQGIETDTGLSYNPNSGILTTTSVTGNLTGNVTGNVSGSAGSATGNAATATALATARNIGGVSFDGTGNIDLPGVNSAGNQNTSGNAATATALATGRNINGVSFDGTGNITVTAAAGTLSGGTLASGVTASSLTSVGTLSGLSVTGGVTVGVDDTGHDVKFFGATSGKYMLWNEDVDELAVLGNIVVGAAAITNNVHEIEIHNSDSDTARYYAKGGGTGYTHSDIRFDADGSTRGAGMYCFNEATDKTWFTGSPYNDADEWIVGRVSSTSFAESAAQDSNHLMKLENDGDLIITGSLTEGSDSRLKENITNVSLGLNFINSLTPRQYTKVGRTRTHMGFVAQEVSAVLPDAAGTSLWVKETANTAGPDEADNFVETQGLRYTEFIAPLVKAVQELSAKVDALEGA